MYFLKRDIIKGVFFCVDGYGGEGEDRFG